MQRALARFVGKTMLPRLETYARDLPSGEYRGFMFDPSYRSIAFSGGVTDFPATKSILAVYTSLATFTSA